MLETGREFLAPGRVSSCVPDELQLGCVTPAHCGSPSFLGGGIHEAVALRDHCAVCFHPRSEHREAAIPAKAVLGPVTS